MAHIIKYPFRWFLFGVFFCLLSNVTFSQTKSDVFTLRGTVRTSAGGIVPATKITATNQNGIKYPTESARNGSYQIELKNGTYEIQFERDGFKRLVVINLGIPLMKSDSLDVRLEPGRCSDCNGELFGERWDDFTKLSGMIFDEDGAVIPNVVVKVRGVDGVERVARSNEEGFYEVKSHIGLNNIRFERPGFEPFVFERYRLARNHKERMNLDVVLVGSTSHEPCGYGGDQCLKDEIPKGLTTSNSNAPANIYPRPIPKKPVPSKPKWDN